MSRRRPSPTAGLKPGASCGRPCSTPRRRGTTSSAVTRPDARTRDAILANPLYENITARFVQSHDYIAMERLHELHSSGRYDLIVVDTPPTRNALDFLDAPERMEEFFGGRLLRWLTAPMRNRVVGVASRPFLTMADRILGARFLQDIAEFFVLLQSMEKGFVSRAREREPSSWRDSPHDVLRRHHAGDRRRRRRRRSSSPSCTGAACPGRGDREQGAARVAAERRPAARSPPGLPRRRRPAWPPRSRDAGRRADAPRSRRVLAEVGESFANYAVVADAGGRAARRAGRRPRTCWSPSRCSTSRSTTWPAWSAWASAAGAERPADARRRSARGSSSAD